MWKYTLCTHLSYKMYIIQIFCHTRLHERLRDLCAVHRYMHVYFVTLCMYAETIIYLRFFFPFFFIFPLLLNVIILYYYYNIHGNILQINAGRLTYYYFPQPSAGERRYRLNIFGRCCRSVLAVHVRKTKRKRTHVYTVYVAIYVFMSTRRVT